VALLCREVAAGAFAALPLDAGALLPQAAGKSSIAAMKHRDIVRFIGEVPDSG
jgi:hypothetical protein